MRFDCERRTTRQGNAGGRSLAGAVPGKPFSTGQWYAPHEVAGCAPCPRCCHSCTDWSPPATLASADAGWYQAAMVGRELRWHCAPQLRRPRAVAAVAATRGVRLLKRLHSTRALGDSRMERCPERCRRHCGGPSFSPRPRVSQRRRPACLAHTVRHRHNHRCLAARDNGGAHVNIHVVVFGGATQRVANALTDVWLLHVQLQVEATGPSALVEWQRKEPSGEPPPDAVGTRQFRTVADCSFLVGKGRQRRNISNTVHVLDTTRNTWRCAAVRGVPPAPRRGFNCIRRGDSVFIAGGYNVGSKATSQALCSGIATTQCGVNGQVPL